jgi:hypothetical protein
MIDRRNGELFEEQNDKENGNREILKEVTLLALII